ncbi:MAG: PAS domain S-box protein [Candidatus Thorarchaeota archaeon]
MAIQALNLGADYYLEKGEDLESLFTEIGHYIRNVVRSRKTERALFESEQRYRTLVKSMSDQIYVLDEQNRFIQFNSPDRNPHLHHPKEILGKPADDVFPSSFMEPFHTFSSEVRATGERKSFDFRLSLEEIDKWLTVDLDLHEDQNSIIVILRDITERKKAENEVKLAEREWRNTFDSLPDLVSVLDNNFRIIKANKSMADALGCSREDLIGRACYEVMHRSDSPFPGCPHLITMETGEKATAEILDPNLGDPYLVTTSPIFEEDGNPAGVVHICHNISDRVKAESAIRESESRFRAIFERAGIGMALVSMKGQVLEANDALCEFLGYDNEELLTLKTDEFTHPKDTEHDDIALQNMLDTGETQYQIQKRYVRKDGETVWGKLTVSLIKDADGTPQATIGMVEDVTAQIQAETLLMAERDRAQSYLDIAEVILVALDTDGNVTLINRKGCEVLEYSKNEALGQNWFEVFVPQKIQKETMNFFLELIDGQLAGTRIAESLVRTKSGKERIISWVNSVLQNEEGEIVGTLSSGQDISEQRYAERAFEESERKYQTLVENAAEGIIILEPETMTLQFCNSKITEIFGYNSEELAEKGTKGVFELLDESQREPLMNHLIDLTNETSIGSQFEIQGYNKNGKKISLILGSSLIDLEKGSAILITILDITKRKLAEDKLEKEKVRAETYLDMAGTLIIATDSDLNLTLINKEGCRILGRPQEELIGKNWINDFIPEWKKDEIRDYMLGVISGDRETTPGVPGPVLDANGNIRWIQWSDVVLTKTEGIPSSILSAGLDITKKKQAEEELRASESRFRLIFDHAPIGMSHAGMDGSLFRVNNALADMLGYTHDELTRLNVESITHPDDWKEECRLNQELLEGTRDVYTIEKRYYDNQGQIVWGRLNVSIKRNDTGTPEFVIGMVEDISENVKLRDELRSSGEFLNSIFEASPIAIDAYDSEGVFIRANNACLDLFGIASEQVLNGHNIFSDPNLSENDKQKMQAGETLRFEGSFNFDMFKQQTTIDTSKSGEEHHESVIAPLGIDDSGNPRGFIIQTLDISERVKAERKLQESEARFRAMFEHAAVGVARVDVSGEILEANKTLEDMLGYSSGELKGINAFDITTQEHREIESRFSRELIEGKRDSYNMIKCYMCKNGRKIWGRLTVSLVRNYSDNPEFTIGILEDFTKQKLAEEALRYSEAKFRRVFEKAGIGITLVGIDDYIIDANSAYQEMLGYNIEELRQMKIADFTHPEDALVDASLFKEILDKKRNTYQMIKRYITKDGKTIWVNLTVTVVRDDDGEISYIIGMAENISDRKSAEEDLKASETKFRQVIDSSPMGILVYQQDSEENLILVETNLAADRLLGVNHNSLIGKTIQETFPSLENKENHSELWDIAKNGSLWKGERVSYEKGQISQALDIYAFQSSPGQVVITFLDSKDRRITEQTLKFSEENLRTLFDTVEDMLFIVGLDSRIITTNKSARERLGYTEEELQGLPAVQLHPVERRDEAAVILQEMIDGQTTFCPVPLMRRDGTNLPVETQITLGKWQGSNVLFGISRDVSQRMIVEKALEKQVEFLNEVIESLDHPFYVIDVNDYTIQMANRVARNGVEQIEGTCYSITHLNSEPCSGKDHPCPLFEVSRTKSRVLTEHIHYDAKGNPRDVEVHAHPVLNENGEVIQMIEYSIDITERKNALRALEASEQRFRDLFEKAPLGYQTLDVDGKIINVNQAWLDTMGYTKGDIVGQYLVDFMTSESKELFIEIFPNFKSNGFMRNIEFEMIKSNGTILVARFNGRVAYDENGKFKQTHCIFQDITDWKIADGLLRRQKEELSELAHMMSHDLGNKMKNIRSLAKIMLKNPNGEVLQRIDNIAQQSAVLLQASAELADAGMVIEKKEKVDLNAIVREIAQTTLPDSVSFQVDDLPSVMGSPERLSQIFQNLLVNALEHGKPTKIEVRRVELSTGTSIVIRNDGATIPANIRSSIFRRGFTTKERGTGLGLSIVKKLVEAHGWSISLEKGKTTGFVITLDSVAT